MIDHLSPIQVAQATAICDRMLTSLKKLQAMADQMKIDVDRWKLENEARIAKLREPVKL